MYNTTETNWTFRLQEATLIISILTVKKYIPVLINYEYYNHHFLNSSIYVYLHILFGTDDWAFIKCHCVVAALVAATIAVLLAAGVTHCPCPSLHPAGQHTLPQQPKVPVSIHMPVRCVWSEGKGPEEGTRYIFAILVTDFRRDVVTALVLNVKPGLMRFSFLPLLSISISLCWHYCTLVYFSNTSAVKQKLCLQSSALEVMVEEKTRPRERSVGFG